ERIAKVIARTGVASRRDAEAMIAEGRVTLNGAVLDSPAVNVTEADRITVDGEPLPARERTRLWLFHKPRGLVTTARDPEGRPTVFESLPPDLPRVVAVGRLDINTEGLLLLTNDGGLARVLAHPTTGWLRRYKVRAYGEVSQAQLDGLRGGITLEGIDYGPIEARLDRAQGDNAWITMGLREGKNREIKVILEHLGLQVNRLIRVSFGPFQLGDLEMGLVDEVPTRVLRDQLGDALAAEAGVDFASPVREPIDDRADRRAARETDRRERYAPPREDDRPRRPRDDERPARGRFDDERPARAPRAEARPTRAPAGPRRTSWRAGEEDEAPKPYKPRRKLDPQAVRAESAERPRERVGAIQARKGKVLVERLVAQPKPERAERPARRPREEGAPERPARAPRREAYGDDAPRRPRARPEGGERPARAPRGDDRGPPRGPRPERGARPERGPRTDRDERGPPRGPRPERAERGPPRGPRPERSDRGPPRGPRPDRDGKPPRRGPPPGGRGGGPRGRRD
ncbi:MAG TPA: pseudouridine synthase, partial [Salinarimonas sp.]|nr:pseudouridine synthase [Salinarimonas sp.]